MRYAHRTLARATRLTARCPLVLVMLVLAALLLAACTGEQTTSSEGTGAEPTTTAPSQADASGSPSTSTGGGPAADEAVDTASTPADEVPDEELTVELNPDVVAAHNRLGMLVFQQLVSQQPGDATESIFLSPTSIALALSMAWNGADGDTEAAMAGALQLADALGGDLTRADIHAANLALLQELADTDVRLDIANSIWYREELAFNPEFLRENERFYRALVSRLDFKAAESVDIINRWVSDTTQGLIPSVVEQLDDDQIMMLVNAVYFKGDWTTPFDAHLTRDMPFYAAAGDSRNVPMMYREGRIEYFEDGFQAVRLPYGDEERLAMYVFLPPADVDIHDFTADFTYETLTDTFARFAPARGEVLLPRMDIAYKANLNEPLRALGMGVAFDAGAADFGRMRPAGETRNIYIGDVIHQSVLKVDEEGTEAAAVTSVDFRVTSLPMYDFRFQADRPFVVVIRDDATGALLFVGAVTDPGATNH